MTKSFIARILGLIKDPAKIIRYLNSKHFFNFLPDECFLKFMFRMCVGKKLNLKNPQTFNEKLQWLKLNDRNPLYTTMVNKYEVKKYVANIIGEEYIIPTLGFGTDLMTLILINCQINSYSNVHTTRVGW